MKLANPEDVGVSREPINCKMIFSPAQLSKYHTETRVAVCVPDSLLLDVLGRFGWDVHYKARIARCIGAWRVKMVRFVGLLPVEAIWHALASKKRCQQMTLTKAAS